MIPYQFHKTIPFLIGLGIGGLLILLGAGVELFNVTWIVGSYAGFMLGWWARTSHVNRDYILMPKGEVDDDPEAPL